MAQTVCERFARWETDDTWAKLLEHARIREDAVGTVKRTVSVDSTIARSHQHASGACGEKTPAGNESNNPARTVGDDQALGRSRGGLTTKVRLARDGRGLPLALVVTPGNVNDSTVFHTVVGTLRVPRAGAGRPRCRPDAIIADKAYSSRAIRQALRGRGIRAVIPERTDQKANCVRRGQAGGRPPTFDRELYTDCNVVERCFARLKQFRAIATRFDKLANRYKAGFQLAPLILWLREPAQGPLPDGP